VGSGLSAERNAAFACEAAPHWGAALPSSERTHARACAPRCGSAGVMIKAQLVTRERSRRMPDGAFAPSETFSPDLRAHTNGQRRNERSGRGECPVPPRLMGYTPSGSNGGTAGAFRPTLARSRPQTPRFQPVTRERSRRVPDGAFAPSETFSSDLRAHTNGQRRNERSGRGECPVPPWLMGHLPSGASSARRGLGPARGRRCCSLSRANAHAGCRTGHSPRPKRFLRICGLIPMVSDGINVRDGANAPSRRG
jgi:hypothetical protein